MFQKERCSRYNTRSDRHPESFADDCHFYSFESSDCSCIVLCKIKTHSSFLYIGERKNLQNRILLLKQDFLFIREGSETQS